MKFYGIQGGCASSRLIHEFSDCDQSWGAGTQSLPASATYACPHLLSMYVSAALYDGLQGSGGFRCMIWGASRAPNFQAVIKSPASAASLDSVKFQAVIKSAASSASLRGGRASGRLDHGFFWSQLLAALSAKQIVKQIGGKCLLGLVIGPTS